MRGLNAVEVGVVNGGINDEEYPFQEWQGGVSQFEWDQLIDFLEEQGRRNGTR